MLCPACGSNGRVQFTIDCPHCQGKGQIAHWIEQGFERSPKAESITCARCRGTRKQSMTEQCRTCAGTGQAKEETRVLICAKCGGAGMVALAIGAYPSGMAKYQQAICPECHGAKQIRRTMLVPDFS